MPPSTPWTLSDSEHEAALKLLAASSLRADVIIPAKNEAATIGPIVDAVRHCPQVAEVLVVDDHCDDDTAEIATRHGARVVALDQGTGKGQAMAAGVAATAAPYLVFLDGDVLSPTDHFVTSLLAPFATPRPLAMVKGYYRRPLYEMPSGGGRVTELTARPVLSLLHPGLGELRQPLAGETAVRREVLAVCPLASGYGVEMALLLDVATHFGHDAIAQVDLGVRRHRNRPLEELRPMATEILRVALTRSGIDLPGD